VPTVSRTEPAVIAPTKERIVNASAELFRRHGYTGTGLKRIVTEADAPFGSLYHFFPGGKEQLGEEVIRQAGGFYLLLWQSFFESNSDPVTAVGDFFAGAAETLRTTGYEDACPIATVALEVASTSEPMRKATADVFESWLGAAASGFTEAGIPRKRARELAIEMLAILEGAFILARATRSTEPLAVAGANATAAIRAALPARRGRGGGRSRSAKALQQRA
jgi:AcrR family transcriptional regulator